MPWKACTEAYVYTTIAPVLLLYFKYFFIFVQEQGEIYLFNLSKH